MISRVCSEAFLTRIHRGFAGFGSCQGSTCLVWLRPAGCSLFFDHVHASKSNSFNCQVMIPKHTFEMLAQLEFCTCVLLYLFIFCSVKEWRTSHCPMIPALSSSKRHLPGDHLNACQCVLLLAMFTVTGV